MSDYGNVKGSDVNGILGMNDVDPSVRSIMREAFAEAWVTRVI